MFCQLGSSSGNLPQFVDWGFDPSPISQSAALSDLMDINEYLLLLPACFCEKRITRLYHKMPKALKSQVAMFRHLIIEKSFLKLFTMRNMLKEHSIMAINKIFFEK